MGGHFIVGYFSCFWSNENVFYFSVSFSQLCFYFYLICRKRFHLVITNGRQGDCLGNFFWKLLLFQLLLVCRKQISPLLKLIYLSFPKPFSIFFPLLADWLFSLSIFQALFASASKLAGLSSQWSISALVCSSQRRQLAILLPHAHIQYSLPDQQRVSSNWKIATVAATMWLGVSSAGW